LVLLVFGPANGIVIGFAYSSFNLVADLTDPAPAIFQAVLVAILINALAAAFT
jgi:hypothetical protein